VSAIEHALIPHWCYLFPHMLPVTAIDRPRKGVQTHTDFSLPGHPHPHNGLYEGYGARKELVGANLTPSRNDNDG
jgi:hypothetical protein